MWITKILGLKNIAIIAVGASLLFYIWWLNSSLDSAVEDKEKAEKDTILIDREFNTLSSSHKKLTKKYDEQGEYHVFSVNLLNKEHEKEITRIIAITKIKQEIENVKVEDDGNISAILNYTLDSLRLYE